jgi:cytochrome oxidase assembly protein ShyY1
VWQIALLPSPRVHAQVSGGLPARGGPAGPTRSGAPRPSGYRGGVTEPRPQTTLLRAAVRPRMIALLVLFLAAATVCGMLGAWQLDRAQVRGAKAEDRHVAELVAAPPVPLADVLTPQTSFRGDMVSRKVTVTGTYDAAAQLLVGDRAHDGVTGYLVVTPLREAGGAVLPVVRGWVESPDDADAPPAGAVTLVGYLQASEQAGDGVRLGDGPDDGRADAVSSAELLNVWGGPIYTGYLVVATSDPAQSDALALLDPPRKPGAGLNLQNLAYAAQWWLFGGFAVLLWLRLVRDEAAGGRPEPRGAPAGATGPPAPPQAPASA